jgi:hypothetical protein
MSEFEVFLADRRARSTLALVGDTWSVVVVIVLGERPPVSADDVRSCSAALP